MSDESTNVCENDEFIEDKYPKYTDLFFLEVLQFCDAFYSNNAYETFNHNQFNDKNNYLLFTDEPYHFSKLDIVSEIYDIEGLNNTELPKIKDNINNFAWYFCFKIGRAHV